jgi:hypothetical protein
LPRCRKEERRRIKHSNELCRYKLCDGCCAKQLAENVANTMWVLALTETRPQNEALKKVEEALRWLHQAKKISSKFDS